MTMTMMCGGPAGDGGTAVDFAVGRGLAGATGTSVGTGTGATVGGAGWTMGGGGGAGMASLVAAGVVGLGVAEGRLATTRDRCALSALPEPPPT
jgi:hypothetical protein